MNTKFAAHFLFEFNIKQPLSHNVPSVEKLVRLLPILSCGDGERQATLKLSQPRLLYLWWDELDYGGAQWLHTTVVIWVVQRPHSTVHLHTKTHTISICTVSLRNAIFICTIRHQNNLTNCFKKLSKINFLTSFSYLKLSNMLHD